MKNKILLSQTPLSLINPTMNTTLQLNFGEVILHWKVPNIKQTFPTKANCSQPRRQHKKVFLSQFSKQKPSIQYHISTKKDSSRGQHKKVSLSHFCKQKPMIQYHISTKKDSSEYIDGFK